MSIYRLEIDWARNANQRRHLNWEFLTCDEVLGVFPTTLHEVVAVLFRGDRHQFDTWARSFVPPHRHHATAPTKRKGALR